MKSRPKCQSRRHGHYAQVGLEDGAGNQAVLILADAALPVQQPTAAARQEVWIGLSARRAEVPLVPAPSDDRGLALLVRAVQIQELVHRQTNLELNAVHRH